jgi:hypothetical protein
MRSIQQVTPEQVLRMPGQPGVDYMLDRPPYTRYYWDGTKMAELGAVSGAGNLELSLTRFTRRTYGAGWTAGGSGSWTSEVVTHPVYGQGVKLTTGTGGTDMAWVDVTDANGLGYFTHRDCLSVLVSDGLTNGSSLCSFRVTNTTDASANTSNYNFATPSFSGARLIDTRIDADTYAGAQDAALPAGITVRGLRLRIGNNGGTTPTSLTFYGIYKNRVNRRGAILIDFDDAFISQYTQAWTYMRPLGIVGNVCVISDTVGKPAGSNILGNTDPYDYMSLDQLRSMMETGWGMITHGYLPHRTGLVSRDNIRADVLKNRDYVAANLDPEGATHYVLPAGQESPHTLSVLSELGFVTNRTTEPQLLSAVPHPNPMFMQSVQVSAFTGLATLQKWVDRVVQTGMSVRFNAHRIVTTVADSQNEISIADFQALMTYIAPLVQQGRVWNPNLIEYWRAVRSRQGLGG